jgi:hypothetical protein
MCVCVFFNLAYTQTIGELRRSARTTFENGNSYLARIAVCMSPYLFALDGIISSDGVSSGFLFIFSADRKNNNSKEPEFSNHLIFFLFYSYFINQFWKIKGKMEFHRESAR